MAEKKDPLSEFQFPESEGGLFLDLKEENSPQKIRVMDTDPVISTDRYGNTRFAFKVYSHNHESVKVLNKGISIAKQIQDIHMDEDLGADVTKVDLKIKTEGSGKETRHTIVTLPKPVEIPTENWDEAEQFDLDRVIKTGIRMSEANAGKEVPKIDPNEQKQPANTVDIEDIGDDEDIDLSEVPF